MNCKRSNCKFDEENISQKVVRRLVVSKRSDDVSREFYNFAISYNTSANVYADYFVKGQRFLQGELDRAIYPIAFMFRHNIELMLKAILFQYVLDTEQRKCLIHDDKHCLKTLFDSVIDVSLFKRSDAEISWMNDFFVSISSFDKQSDAFRYPNQIITDHETKIMKEKKLIDGYKSINIVDFTTKMNYSFEILNRWYLKRNDTLNKPNGINSDCLNGSYCECKMAVINWFLDKNCYFDFVDAYKEACEYLGERIIYEYDNGNYHMCLQLIYPMCYMFRNCIELVQKMIYEEPLNGVKKKDLKKLSGRKHSLIGMFNLIKPKLHQCYETDIANDPTYLKRLEAGLNEINQKDSKANYFRYPVDLNLNPYIKNDQVVDVTFVYDLFYSKIDNYEGIYLGMLD